MRKKHFYLWLEFSVVVLATVILFYFIFPRFISGQKFGALTENESEVLFGDWVWEGNQVTQTDSNAMQTILLFQHEYKNMEITLKAKAHEGREGFRIIFGYTSPQSLLLWNIGGYDNTKTGVEFWNENNISPMLNQGKFDQKSYKVEYDEWYDIRLLVNGDERRIIGYVDGEKIDDYVLDKPITGRIGLSTFYTSVTFADIAIQPFTNNSE